MKSKLFFTNTNHWRKYWKGLREGVHINWNAAYVNPDHPHRQIIVDKLRRFRFRSVLEVGCAAGANLYKIKLNFPDADVGGIDWNPDAIAEAKRILPKVSVLQVGEASDVYISDKGADIILSDMCHIYLDKKDFIKALKEAKRVARNGVIFCELNHTNWFMRLYLKCVSGYNAFNYRKELKRLGFHDIEIYKLQEQDWPGGEPQKSFGAIITARP